MNAPGVVGGASLNGPRDLDVDVISEREPTPQERWRDEAERAMLHGSSLSFEQFMDGAVKQALFEGEFAQAWWLAWHYKPSQHARNAVQGRAQTHDGSTVDTLGALTHSAAGATAYVGTHAVGALLHRPTAQTESNARLALFIGQAVGTLTQVAVGARAFSRQVAARRALETAEPDAVIHADGRIEMLGAPAHRPAVPAPAAAGGLQDEQPQRKVQDFRVHTGPPLVVAKLRTAIERSAEKPLFWMSPLEEPMSASPLFVDNGTLEERSESNAVGAVGTPISDVQQANIDRVQVLMQVHPTWNVRKAARMAAKLNQEQAAEVAGTDQGAYSRWERNQVPWSAQRVARLIARYQLPADFLDMPPPFNQSIGGSRQARKDPNAPRPTRQQVEHRAFADGIRLEHAWRLESGLSQKTVAGDLGFSAHHLKDFESGDSVLSPQRYADYAQYLSVAPEAFSGLTSVPPKDVLSMIETQDRSVVFAYAEHLNRHAELKAAFGLDDAQYEEFCRPGRKYTDEERQIAAQVFGADFDPRQLLLKASGSNIGYHYDPGPDPSNRLPSNVERWRDFMGPTAEEMGRRLQVNKKQLHDTIERARRPQSRRLDDYAQALGLPDARLFQRAPTEGDEIYRPESMRARRALPKPVEAAKPDALPPAVAASVRAGKTVLQALFDASGRTSAQAAAAAGMEEGEFERLLVTRQDIDPDTWRQAARGVGGSVAFIPFDHSQGYARADRGVSPMRAARLRHGLSLQGLSARMGVKRQTIHVRETKVFDPEEATIQALANALGEPRESLGDMTWNPSATYIDAWLTHQSISTTDLATARDIAVSAAIRQRRSEAIEPDTARWFKNYFNFRANQDWQYPWEIAPESHAWGTNSVDQRRHELGFPSAQAAAKACDMPTWLFKDLAQAEDPQALPWRPYHARVMARFDQLQARTAVSPIVAAPRVPAPLDPSGLNRMRVIRTLIDPRIGCSVTSNDQFTFVQGPGGFGDRTKPTGRMANAFEDLPQAQVDVLLRQLGVSPRRFDEVFNDMHASAFDVMVDSADAHAIP